MFKSVVTKASRYFKMPNSGLVNYFNLTRSGKSKEIRTTFFADKTLDEVLEPWLVQLGSLRKEWPTLYEFEEDLAAKVGPLSIQAPLADRIPDIVNYYEDIHLPQTEVSSKALAAVISEWKQVGKLKPRSQKQTVENMKLSTNSGSPFFTKRRDVLKKTLPCAVYKKRDGELTQRLSIATSNKIETEDPASTWDVCAILGWRGQEGGRTAKDVKQRVVWMFPFAVNLEELRVYQPLIEKAQEFNIVPAWNGFAAVDEAITNLFDTKGENELIVCTDFSKFDQHFNRVCREGAEVILDGILDESTYSAKWLRTIYPIKYTIPLAVMMDENEDLTLYTGEHGMGSGSGGTNADETLLHRALQYEAAIDAKSRLNPNSMCLGDDGILSYPGITVDKVVETYTRHGLEMNVSKQYASTDDCVYLRQWHHKNYRVNDICVGVYSTCRALGRLLEQERYYDPKVWSKEMVALRQLSILENVKYHPLREEFVQYCMKGDKYRLGLDIPGFLDNIMYIAKDAEASLPGFMGYTQGQEFERLGYTSIATWWIVRYLKSLK